MDVDVMPENETTVTFTMTFSKLYKREHCEGYGIDPENESWALEMARFDAEALQEVALTPDEFFEDATEIGFDFAVVNNDE